MVEQLGTGWPTMPPILYTPGTRAQIYGLDNIAMLASNPAKPAANPYLPVPDILQKHSLDIYSSLVNPAVIMQLYRTTTIPQYL